MDSNYDCEIRIEELKSQVNRFRYTAKPISVVRYERGQAIKVDHLFHNHWGITPDEAYRKCKQDIDDWMAEQYN
jgi:hypothetical protein